MEGARGVLLAEGEAYRRLEGEEDRQGEGGEEGKREDEAVAEDWE